MRTGKLDHLLDGTVHEISTWIELILCPENRNPMYETYLRREYVIIQETHAKKIASANRRDVQIEWHGEEYSRDWNNKPLPPLPQGCARLWCIKAWKLTENHNQELRKIHTLRDHQRDYILSWYIKKDIPEDVAKATLEELTVDQISKLFNSII